MRDLQTIDPTFQKMRRLATALLMVMVVLYVLARSFEGDASFWPWVKAFAEAAMVGALADWFAVTALFRHPLGLPIPHTAIVRKEQKRIGNAVASFVRQSFFTPEEVMKQWQSWRPVQSMVTRFSSPDHVESALKFTLARLPEWISETDRKALARAGASGIRYSASSIPMARVVTALLKGFLKSSDRRRVLAPLMARLARTVEENREWVMGEASKSTKPQESKFLDAFQKMAATAVTGKAVEKFAAELKAASENLDHALYAKVEEVLGETATELENGDTSAWEALKTRLLADPETQNMIEGIIDEALALFLERSTTLEEDGTLRRWSEKIARSAERLGIDHERLARFDQRGSELVASVANRFGPQFETTINRTVESWEADELVEKIENQVGADLQFIRINGTLIGGLVGVLLHGLGLLIWH